ncbi:MAG: hypothetical protein ACE5FZ_08605 [Nitrospiria bacterium]
MSEKDQNEQVGMGAKIGFFLVAAVGLSFYYFIALNWVLMVPIQNLPYPYK